MFELVRRYFAPVLNSSVYINCKRRGFNISNRDIWKPIYSKTSKAELIGIICNKYACFTCFYRRRDKIKRDGTNYESCEICLEGASRHLDVIISPAREKLT